MSGILTASGGLGYTPSAPMNPYRTNLVLELIGDTIVTDGGTDGSAVATWRDTSGSGNDATQATSSKRPTLKAAIINGHAVIRLDGVDDGLRTTSRVTTTRTVIMVVKSAVSTSISFQFVLGDTSALDFCGGNSSSALFDGGYSSSAVLGGSGWVNGGSTAITSIQYPTSFAVISVVASGNCAVSTLADDRGDYGRSWHGDYAEVLIYTEALSDAHRQAVEAYLKTKYGTP